MNTPHPPRPDQDNPAGTTPSQAGTWRRNHRGAAGVLALVAAVGIGTLGLAGCGGDDSEDATPDTQPTSTARADEFATGGDAANGTEDGSDDGGATRDETASGAGDDGSGTSNGNSGAGGSSGNTPPPSAPTTSTTAAPTTSTTAAPTVKVTSVSAPATFTCSSGPYYEGPNTLTLSWSTQGATSVSIAIDSPGGVFESGLPANGGSTVPAPCGGESNTYYVIAIGPNGQQATGSATTTGTN